MLKSHGLAEVMLKSQSHAKVSKELCKSYKVVLKLAKSCRSHSPGGSVIKKQSLQVRVGSGHTGVAVLKSQSHQAMQKSARSCAKVTKVCKSQQEVMLKSQSCAKVSTYHLHHLPHVRC